jgi:hypothetical protein
MSGTVTSDTLGAVLKALVQQEVASILETHASELRTAATAIGDPFPDEMGVSEGPPGDISLYDRVALAQYVLEQAGEPLPISVIAARMYALGYKHRRQPKNPRQIESSLNSLASPSQHPDIFVRVGPRKLGLNQGE